MLRPPLRDFSPEYTPISFLAAVTKAQRKLGEVSMASVIEAQGRSYLWVTEAVYASSLLPRLSASNGRA